MASFCVKYGCMYNGINYEFNLLSVIKEWQLHLWHAFLERIDFSSICMKECTGFGYKLLWRKLPLAQPKPVQKKVTWLFSPKPNFPHTR